MADFTFTYMKGRVAHYHSLVTGSTSGTNGPTVAAVSGSTLIGVLLQATGIEADSSMRDRFTLASVLTASTEVTGVTGYSRFQFTAVAPTADFTGDTISLDTDNAVWTNLGTNGGATSTSGPNNTIGKLIICYKPVGAADSAILPLTAHDFSVSATDGTTLTATINNYYRAL